MKLFNFSLLNRYSPFVTIQNTICCVSMIPVCCNKQSRYATNF